ncbi:antibiotic biosynthesis monooxygenase [Aquabacter sp. CN5-332]|uniref:antibiotic biosynthesis monooxygenase family protein n=1 Tax=Aquabacter sp. CN5-332 TaxID=3156608 RepID=UPI0032B5B930
MYIAMNRFKVKLDSQAEFERVWRERDSYLSRVPGFVAFNLLKGPLRDDHILYSSHTHWQTKTAFEDWTKSDAFRDAHRNAGTNKVNYIGPPEFEGFESVLSLTAS